MVPLVLITGFPQWIPHFSALAFDDDDDEDDDLPWPVPHVLLLDPNLREVYPVSVLTLPQPRILKRPHAL